MDYVKLTDTDTFHSEAVGRPTEFPLGNEARCQPVVKRRNGRFLLELKLHRETSWEANNAYLISHYSQWYQFMFLKLLVYPKEMH